MRRRSFAVQACFVLVLCGVGLVLLRYQARRNVRLGRADTAWRLTYFIEFEARRPLTTVRIASPVDTRHCRLLRQDFRQSNLRIDSGRRSASQVREIVALAEGPGECATTLVFDLHLSSRANWAADDAAVALTADERAEYLQATSAIQVASESVSGTLMELKREAADQAALIRAAFECCGQTAAVGDDDAADDAATALETGRGTPLGCARAMIALCRAAKIPSRPVAGFVIDPADRATVNVWVELLLDNRWVPYDPVNGYERELPYNFVPARPGDDRVVITTGARKLETEFSLAQLPAASLGTAVAEQRLVDLFDLTRLPLEMQRELSLILLIPLGALVTCVFRNIVGLKTSGTFTPTLLALSFVFADWRTGLMVLAVAVVLGIAGRFLIDRLRLLMLPRLSIMLTMVVLCIVFVASSLEYFRIAPRSQTILLPMVILTMLVERFYVTTQEDGAREALQHLAGTALVGFCCYLVLCWETVAKLLLAYPESHCFSVALMVVIGRYTGYQLWEPWRFRDLVDPERT